MRKTITTTIKWLLALTAMFAVLGIAGHYDYEDSVVCEMKNNGAYYELSERYPQATESELVRLYEQECNEQCQD